MAGDFWYKTGHTGNGFLRKAPGKGCTMNEQDVLLQKLTELKTEHRDLDDVIGRLAVQPVIDQLQLQRLKKRKLALKDAMARIESRLLPDIIA